MLDRAALAAATGTLEASIMAHIQRLPQPRHDLGRLRARCSFNEKSGVREWLWPGGAGGGSVCCPVPVYPCQQQVPPPCRPPRGGLATPEETESYPQRTLGPTVMRIWGRHRGSARWGKGPNEQLVLSGEGTLRDLLSPCRKRRTSVQAGPRCLLCHPLTSLTFPVSSSPGLLQLSQSEPTVQWSTSRVCPHSTP